MKSLLVIPAFDEEPTIGSLIESARKHIPDVLVIDDGSNDATTLVSALAGAMIHRLKTNMGKGEALKTAFSYAIEQGYDWVLTMDGSGRHDPGDIPGFLPLLGQYDLILGSRMAGNLPFLRRVANRSSSMIVSALCGQRIHDSQSGFRAYRTEVLRKVPLRSSRYDLEAEVLVRATRRGFRVGHCPIRTVGAETPGSSRNIKDSARFVAIIFKSFTWW